ncbi:MAG TPA: hypothetical protein VHN99_08900, partial [Deinococcales bacterium]|nr:hypothetical protein [Deinococcales bacterium]
MELTQRGAVPAYLDGVRAALSDVPVDELDRMVDALAGAFLEGRQVFTLGNGASAALASHLACDLGKGTASDLGRGPVVSGGRRLRILSLNDNAALMTALGNDLHYRDVFLEQL